NDAPSVSVATTSNTTPIRLTTAITTNGCNIPANTTSGCPASVPSTQTLDGVYRACHIAANQSDCQATTIGYVECPVGFTAGALSVKNGPPAGQAGYGSFVKLMRSIENGRVTIRYDAYEVGVRADGTIAWEGPHGSGLASASAQSCSAEVFRVFFPGSDEGEKVAIDLQWF
ncbi:MAG TPA: hypothetical protein VK601_19290, partial [Kofleriaceae bacterium]|nr:hypothetical protein [Kofleriaceae bacterium]